MVQQVRVLVDKMKTDSVRQWWAVVEIQHRDMLWCNLCRSFMFTITTLTKDLPLTSFTAHWFPQRLESDHHVYWWQWHMWLLHGQCEHSYLCIQDFLQSFWHFILSYWKLSLFPEPKLKQSNCKLSRNLYKRQKNSKCLASLLKKLTHWLKWLINYEKKMTNQFIVWAVISFTFAFSHRSFSHRGMWSIVSAKLLTSSIVKYVFISLQYISNFKVIIQITD